VFKVVEGLRSIELGMPGESRRKLVDAVVNGNKRATAGLLSEYEFEGEPLETVGEREAILDNTGEAVAIVEITKVEVLPFSKVPDEFALAEAEGDLNAEDFRESHLKFWTAAGEVISDATPVVTLYFDVVEIRERNIK
jgi:uncharacterized protein YhfF